MNKLIFQMGVLGFCVATVIFGAGGGSIIEIVSRSFIVFVGIVLAAASIILVAGTMLHRNADSHASDDAPNSQAPNNTTA